MNTDGKQKLHLHSSALIGGPKLLFPNCLIGTHSGCRKDKTETAYEENRILTRLHSY